MEDVSLSYILSNFEIETATLEAEREDEGDETTPSTQIPLTSYFFSNLATKTAVDLMANGAEPNSETQNSLIMHSHGKPLSRVNEIVPYTLEFLTETGLAGGPNINLSRSMWVHPSVALKPAFEDAIKKYYNPDLSSTGFENTEDLKREVNEWIQEKTWGLIQDSLGSTVIGADTRLIVACTLAFEGKWFEPFEYAGVQQFTLLNGEAVSLPFMTSNRKHYVQQFDNYKLLSVPFKQHQASRFSMLFYLPDKIEDLEELRTFVGLEESTIQDVYFPEEQVQVGNFLIPKFKLNVRGPLPWPSFEFPEIANSPEDLISPGGRLTNFLEINESGIRAAGASYFFVDEVPTDQETVAPKIVPSSEEVIDFVANRPFIFFIRDNQFGRMLFSGGLINPVGLSPSFKANSE